ncbi:glycosyltransferase family 4 protein [Actinoplanes sp. L3-i22]|uniref:glycosyltransferase family 4 protein n=1 Tax=Actinoplanes sp. L3-i22 TaxID=2836373 RepID=UPI001C760409|nr:glycosyltransferase family 4 protein [Actinoplanes sp. L3-i22]BCY15474.1 GDP-mannose-dependent alpha-mannosyltransferase [Actinoplanes sp. L3-i22]
MKVLLVSHYFPPHLGGIENVVAEQARHLAAAGAEVVVLTTGRPGGIERLSDGVRVLRVPAWDGLQQRAGIPFPVPGPRLLTSALRWARWADVVHVHDGAYLTSWAAGLAAAVTRTPMVMHQHVAIVDHPATVVRLVQQAVWGTAGRLMLRRAERVFVLNDSVAAFVESYGGRVEHLPNGVDTTLFTPLGDKDLARKRLGLPADRVLVLFAGRLVPKKGYDLLTAAAGPEYDLVFAGEGHDGVPASGPGVHHLGRLDPVRLAEAYRASDVFALPSTSEGFPLTVQEAMACGLPVVTTDDPGYASYRLDRERVRLLPRDAAVLRATLAELAGDPALRDRMGRWSHSYATGNFSWPAHVGVLLDRYPATREVVGRG